MPSRRARHEDVTVSSLELRGLIADLKTQGVPARDIEALSGDQLNVLCDDDARIPAEIYVELLRLGAQCSSDPAYGLHYGARCHPAEGGVVHALASTSATYLDGFRIAIRYLRLLGDVTRAELDIASERAVFRVWVPDARFRHPQVIDVALGRTATTMVYLWGARAVIHEVRMSSAEADPARAAAHREIFGRSAVYGSNDDSIVFDRALLLMPQPHHQPYVHQVLVRHASVLLDRLGSEDSLSCKVRRAIAESLPLAEANAHRVAKALGMSRQTLHRKLALEKTSFASILTSLRREAAVAQLASNAHSIAEIALLLGYSEPAAFNRAFRRWTGQSPSAYRAARRARPAALR
jgi:AraC-like DNA-binding protein